MSWREGLEGKRRTSDPPQACSLALYFSSIVGIGMPTAVVCFSCSLVSKGLEMLREAWASSPLQ